MFDPSPTDPDDEVILEALGAGLSRSEAAALAKVSLKTVNRRMQRPEFRAEVARRRAARAEAISGRLTTIAQQALTVLERAMQSQQLSVATRAADVTLRHMSNFRRHVDLEVALAEAEAAGVDTDVEVEG